MRRSPAFLHASAAVLFLALAASALSTEVPYLSQRVNDTAEILSPETVSSLEALLKAHEDSTSNQVAVLTVASLEGETIEEFSIRVVDSWKLGQKGKDNGILLLVARDDRKVRIEVGRGLEGDLPDITCGSIIRKQILPRFKEGDYDTGVTDGIHAILGAIQGSYVAEEEEASSSDDLWGRVFASMIFLVVVGVFTAVALFTKGGASWFLYFFLVPFWLVFPLAILGVAAGLTVFGLYALGFLAAKLWFNKSIAGRSLQTKWSASPIFASSSSGGWSSGSGSSSSSFSGGGGGFSGGGASGSW
ncbi:TPM domain-containing protein [bacterium]|nr:MAG: TPM domain-containing protein [bacterium]